ncbi:amidohydrolase family protein [Actinomycetospora termitidis]|uniref:Amidohydrolase family protein n=1 Tax=Actinomycetospora termitidis TaxID=3053470 RepID=A0ABT7M4E9_9PSEU|nr:amidohydrolase family protein [Actinomycetospora sp. Odt1-22]MDL5155560.1 amidohydrolase family protein [Actinomycetospora sp. Odt1-22]
MPPDLTVRARRVVLPDGTAPAVVTITDGRIAAVDAYGASVDGPVVDLGADEVLLPGLVDTHVHGSCAGPTTSAVAAAGGVTTLVEMPLHADPPTVDPDALAARRAAARGEVAVDVGFWGAAVPVRGGLPDPAGRVDAGRLTALAQAGVRGFACVLTDTGVPGFPPVGHEDLETAAATCASLGLPLLVHAEDDGVLSDAPPAGPDLRSFLASRPPGAETTAVLRLATLASRTGAHVHVLHVSAFEAAEEIGAARHAGVPLTAETCPHHLALASETLPGTVGKSLPPVRSESNRELLWGALGAGRLDAVVSDHSVRPPEPADRGFDAAYAGMPSLGITLPLVWSGAAARGHTLDDVVGWMAAAPARLAGLPAKGAIEVGRDADLVVLAPDEVAEVDPGVPGGSPYAGLALRGVVRRVWLRGTEAPAAGGGALL